MRITLVNFSLGPGGAERVLSTMANHWAAHDQTVTIVTLHPARSFYPLHERVAHVRLGMNQRSCTLPARAFHLMRRVMLLRRTIHRTRPDIVIAFQTAINVLTLWVMQGSGVPIVVSERIDPAMYTSAGALGDWARRKTYPSAACVIMQSQRALDWLAARTRGRFAVIPNPVPHPAPASAIPTLHRPASSITAMGRLVPQKGFDILIRAFAAIHLHYPQCTLTILGEGCERKKLEALRDSLGLHGCVFLPGVVNTPHEVLRQSDIFVCPSRFEGFPNALCEAMSCGLPVIAADCCSGPREIIEDGVNGLLVPPHDPARLAEAMKQLIEAPSLRRRLAENAATLPERFSLSAIMHQWEQTINRACGKEMVATCRPSADPHSSGGAKAA